MPAATFLDWSVVQREGQIATRIVRGGDIALDPSGIELTADDPFVSVSA